MTDFHHADNNNDDNIYHKPVDTQPTKNHLLENQLIFWFLLLSLLPLVIVAWVSYQQANNSLSQAATEELELSEQLNRNFIQNWFDYRFMDLRVQAKTRNNAQLLTSLIEGLTISGTSPKQYIKSNDWVRRTTDLQNDLINLNQHYDYIYDVFLIDNEGNILYSIAKEDDLGSNLFYGPYKNTLFAATVSQSLITEQMLFSDLERYDPSNNIISGFLTAPLLGESGKKIGVFAIQIRMDRLISFFTDSKQRLITSYLMGSDGLLRTPINGQEDELLNRRVETEQFRRWKTTHSDDMHEQAFEYVGPDGKEVIGIHYTVDIANISWIIISEIEVTTALKEAIWLRNIMILLVFITGFLVVCMAIYQSRRITQPIIKLANASMSVAAGELDQHVEVSVNNEIGRLADAFNHMLSMRKIHEQALEQSTAESHQALDRLAEQRAALNEHAIVTITDVKGTIIYVNEKFIQISGYSRVELIGKNHRMVNSGLHDKAFFKGLYHNIANGNVWHGEICNKAKEGHLYWVDATIVPLPGKDGKPVNYIAIRTDITERKKTEFSLLEAKEAAEIAVKAKSEFLASMSHEIRTPMNGVLGMLGLLLNSELSDKQRHKASLAQSSAQSLLALINDILDFSKVEAGKLELETMDFNLRSLLGEFAEAMALRAQEKGLEMVLDVTQVEHSTVQGDSGRLRQILTNIVGNAIKFTQTGEIVIRTGLKETTDNNMVFFCSIKDTGIGIPKEKQAKLFDAFTQVDASTTRKYGGTGLGLSIVKRLCELMGGGISVSSKPGKGAYFEFTITLQTSNYSSPVIPTINMNELNLLVVDDNKTNREVLIGQLEHWGAKVTEAESGSSALACLYERAKQSIEPPFDVAFLDMQMPGMDGAELGKTIRSDTRFNNMKMVMMTSMNHRGDAKFYADHGFNAYFPKPATTSDLFDALAVVVDGGEALRNAGPLVTHDYLQTLDHSHSSKWPDNTRLLLVEDNRINQEVAQGVLENLELKADIAGDGFEALHALNEAPSKNPYTLILMDCQMPEMDGYEASRNIRAGKAGSRNQSIPIIAMTANAMKGDKEKCLKAGMNDYLTKPIDPDALNSIMDKWLGESPKPSITLKSIDNLMDSNMTNTCEEGSQIWDKAAVLKRLGGKEKFLHKLLTLFASDTSQRIEELQSAVTEGNINDIANLAHTIKGSAANISGLQLQQYSAELELMAKEGEKTGIEPLMKKIINSYQLLNSTLVQYQESVEAPKE